MGQSITLLSKAPLELSVEIDRNISIEISTGFGSSDRPTVSVNIPVEIDELREIVLNLSELYARLKTAKKCNQCGALSPANASECNNCDNSL